MGCPTPARAEQTWTAFREGLTALNRVRVPRWLGMHPGRTTTIHGFCDASSKAYAAVIYLRTTDDRNQVHVSLLTATIPRLELCAAHLLVTTLANVQRALELQPSSCYFWSDSRIVLCWLRKEPSTLKPYVANRVRHIQELSSPGHWHLVRSAQNSADCASRGIGAENLLQHQLWWQGPSWLKTGLLPIGSPGQLNDEDLIQIKQETKTLVISGVTCVPPQLTTRRPDGVVILLTERFSSLYRLLHTVSYMYRWHKSHRSLIRTKVVGADELDHSLNRLILLEQATAFPKEIHEIRCNAPLFSTSPLLSLNPYLDTEGLLRVGGRLTNAAISYEQRFPVVLPKTGALVWLLVKHTHETTMHGGVQLMLQTLRRKYWIMNGRQAIRSYVHKCVTCRRHRGTLIRQQMAPLPVQRVTAARPFIASGVDYCGPFTLRTGSKRSRTTIKGYLAIFICMATKAVHIEVIEDLTSHAFLNAFTRFTSRRGPCSDLYSDNGTAFVGANRLMKEDLAIFQSQYNQQYLAHAGTRWHFITPGAPHQGGLWEAAVKSAKHHLVRLIGTQSLWYHQLHTIAARIEACLNSRPLVPLHDDPDDKLALTPGDFLIGAPLIAVPEPQIGEVPINRLKQYQWLSKLHQDFWRRWSEEYLTTLQTRNKWEKKGANIQKNDIVLVRNENLPPTHWRLGRVIAVHPGRDGLARNITLKTAAGECNRPVQKLCRLVEG